MRSLSREEAEFLRGRDWNLVPMKRIRSGGDWISETVSPIRGRPVYLSIDLDALDPSIMPAVGTPEPGGMSWDEVLAVTSEIARRAEVVAFDVVELAPIPGLVAPDFLAAELIYKVIGRLI